MNLTNYNLTSSKSKFNFNFLKAKLIAFTMLFIFAFNSNAQKYELGYNLQKNEVYNQNLKCNISIKQEVGGQKMDINMSVNSASSFKIIDIKADVYKAKVTYDKISMDMNMGMGGDAMNKVKEMMDKMMNSIKGKSFEMEMTKKGKVNSVKGMDSLFMGMFDSIPNMPEEAKAQMRTQVEESMGEKSFIANMEQMTAFFPANAVAVGEKWTNTNTVNSSTLSLTMNGEFTLKEVKADYYIITGSGNVTTPDNAQTKKTNGMEMKMNMGGLITYTLKIDRKTGWLINVEILQNLKGNTEILPSESIPDGMKIPMEMINNMVITN